MEIWKQWRHFIFYMEQILFIYSTENDMFSSRKQ